MYPLDVWEHNRRKFVVSHVSVSCFRTLVGREVAFQGPSVWYIVKGTGERIEITTCTADTLPFQHLPTIAARWLPC